MVGPRQKAQDPAPQSTATPAGKGGRVDAAAGVDARCARRQIVGQLPKRADVILAGACAVRTVMDKLGRDALTVSDRGLRHGVLLERLG